MTDYENKCGSCKWLNLNKKTSVGYVCENPKIHHKNLGYLKQMCHKACKAGYEKMEENENEQK